MWRFLRRGDARSSVLIALAMTLFTLFSLSSDGMASSRTATLLAIELPLAFAIAWLITAKLGSDLAAVHAQNAEAAERREALLRRLGDDEPWTSASEDEFGRLVQAEMDALPAWLATAIEERNVGIMIDDELPPDPRTLGLYRTAGGTAQIVLYRRTIMRAAGGEWQLRRVIHDTLLHELGHLFGMSERDLDRYTIGNNPLPDAQPVHPPSLS
ncbi:MAG: metallopeptidase family protein [Gaiellales bacterium]